MTSRRWAPALLIACLGCALLAVPSPAMACMNELAASRAREAGLSLMVGLAAIVAFSLIVRPVLDGAGSLLAIVAAWVGNLVVVWMLAVVGHGVGLPPLNEIGLAAAFALSLPMAPTYRFIRAIRQRIVARREATASAARMRDEPAANQGPGPSVSNDERAA